MFSLPFKEVSSLCEISVSTVLVNKLMKAVLQHLSYNQLNLVWEVISFLKFHFAIRSSVVGEG